MADLGKEHRLIFSFSLTDAEARECVRALAARQSATVSKAPFFLGLALGVPVVGLSVILALGLGFLVRLEARSVLIAAVLAYFVGFFVAQWQFARVRRRIARDLYREYVGGEPRKVELTDEGVSAQTSDRRTLYRWTAVQGTEIDGPLLLIWVGAATGLVPIPLRAFKDGEQQRALELIRRHTGAGADGPGAGTLSA